MKKQWKKIGISNLPQAMSAPTLHHPTHHRQAPIPNHFRMKMCKILFIKAHKFKNRQCFFVWFHPFATSSCCPFFLQHSTKKHNNAAASRRIFKCSETIATYQGQVICCKTNFGKQVWEWCLGEASHNHKKTQTQT